MPSLRDLADRVLGRRAAPPPRLVLPEVPTSEQILADLERFYDDVDDHHHHDDDHDNDGRPLERWLSPPRSLGPGVRRSSR